MIIQLDLSKAYDKVSWTYLEAILKAFGFSQSWISWILAMVKSPSFSILVNGAPSDPFFPSRGIRQGDPISPFLFVMEGLSRIIKSAKDRNIIKVLQPLTHAPTTTHQQFVDDTMLHGTPIVKEAQGFKAILNLFSRASADKHKWALVAWTKLCKPKVLGGLGLQDPDTINKYYGAKLWWRWLKEPHTPWEKLWKAKYAETWRSEDPIRMIDAPEGSPIWNLARANSHLIQNHCFWEIRNGNKALFWEDAWQQLPKLENPNYHALQRWFQEMGKVRVHKYWSDINENQHWRKWNLEPLPLKEDMIVLLNNLNSDLNKRMIRSTQEEDQLKWEKLDRGTFNLKEARIYLEHQNLEDKVAWYQNVWNSALWPKIKYFLWLIMHRKILTWENLVKRGFIGPSKCPLCEKDEETMNHFLNDCNWTNNLWEWIKGIFKQTDRHRDSIQDSITNWRTNYSSCNTINTLWRLCPGFIVWNTWKERNRRIFQKEFK
eukprot:PITA_13691